MKFDSNLKLRSIAGEDIIIIPPKTADGNSQVMSLNKVASFIWKNFQGKDFEADDIVSLILQTYEITPERAREDVGRYISQMKDSGVIV